MNAQAPRHGVARVLSKSGIGSRTQAAMWVREGRVRVNGRVVTDPEFPVRQGADQVTVDGHAPTPGRLVVMLNKPRGLVTTRSDEQGRDTVYRCFEGAALPWLAPVGRLDKASEGLLLFTNDPTWAAGISQPASQIDKTYHVQIDRLADAPLLARLERGTQSQRAQVHGARVEGSQVEGERLAKSARLLRTGEKNSWLEITLDEGRNRQIRRLLAQNDIAVLRLVRIGIGSLRLGNLAKGAWRELTESELAGFK